ncbi:MAG: HAD family hydrolase, partial [Chloroflexota bacterium]
MEQSATDSSGHGKYRLVISDIDGTLLDSTSTLRPSVITAVQAARRAGIIFTLATGRRYVTTEPILRELGLLDDPSDSTPGPGNEATLPPPVLAPPV